MGICLCRGVFVGSMFMLKNHPLHKLCLGTMTMGTFNKSPLKFNPVIKGEAKPGMLFLISLTAHLFLSFVDSQWTTFILNYQLKCTSCSLCRSSCITSSFGFVVFCFMFTGLFLQLHWNNPSIIQWLSSYCSVSLSLFP